MLYRSQLSNISKTPIHLPALPQVSYQQFCQQKAVHCSDEDETTIGGLIVERITIPPYQPSLQLNRKHIIPPIKRIKQFTNDNQHKDTQHIVHERHGPSNMQVHVKWNDSCKCTRCKIMKNDYEDGVDDKYSHWGKYPCIPDAIINRDEQNSSDDEQG